MECETGASPVIAVKNRREQRITGLLGNRGRLVFKLQISSNTRDFQGNFHPPASRYPAVPYKGVVFHLHQLRGIHQAEHSPRLSDYPVGDQLLEHLSENSRKGHLISGQKTPTLCHFSPVRLGPNAWLVSLCKGQIYTTEINLDLVG